MQERTGDGYVFRCDLRLRPDPASTPPALSVAAALAYYESAGQNWERAALIKARPVAGDIAAGDAFLRELTPFLWRKSLDFAAIQDIHSIKRQINAHHGGKRIAVAGPQRQARPRRHPRDRVLRPDAAADLGRPLARAARTPEPATRSARSPRRDASARPLPPSSIDAYRFLRRVEHRLQMVDDAQTHTLPADAAGLARIAIFMGYPSLDAFVAELKRHLIAVESHYAALFEEAPSLAAPGNLVFTGSEDDPETLGTLAALGLCRSAGRRRDRSAAGITAAIARRAASARASF